MTDQDRPFKPDPGAAQREAEFLERVRNVVPLVQAQAQEAEELRYLPDATVQAIEETGMFRMHTPLAYGGLQLGLNAHVQSARILAQGDLSTAWAASFLSGGSAAVAKQTKDVQDRIFGEQIDVRACGSGQWRPGANIVRDGDSYVINGRWGFVSGIHNARYVSVTLPMEDEEGRKQLVAASFVPTDQVQILDVWHMSGMKATGSQDIFFDNVRLAPEFVNVYKDTAMGPNPGIQLYPDYPYLRYSIQHVIWTTHVSYILGAAERALEYFRTEILPGRKPPWGNRPVIESPVVQRNYAEARYLVETGAVLFDHRIKTIVDLYERGVEPDWDLRAYLNTDSVGIIRQASQAIQIVARMSGGSMHRSNNPLDRIQRDVEVLMNHASADWDYHAESSGRVQLGLGLGDRPEEFF